MILDLLVIHPFADGNGRVARALTNALLIDAGYEVCRWVSLEQLIADSADAYYAALLRSTDDWHQDQANPWPWLSYFVSVLASAYQTFARRAAADQSGGTKQERVRDYVVKHAAAVFRIADVRAALPGVSDQTIRLVLDQLRNDGKVKPHGTGRAAVWVRVPDQD
jgi:Fic family protein